MEAAQGVLGYVMGPGLIPQILLTIVTLFAIQIAVGVVETVVNAIRRLDRQTTLLFEHTTATRQTVIQARGADNLIFNSENEVHGLEFTYSMYVLISPETFSNPSTSAGKLKHIFHKGSKDGFPLLGPGVFCDGTKNTLHIYMNSSTKWDNAVTVPNVPVGKWFHLVIIQKGKFMDVYINGNVTVRHEFAHVPKINYGSVYMLADDIHFPSTNSNISPSVLNGFAIDGAMKGMLSRVKYYAYALNYAQIDELYREAPSKVIVSPTFEQQPPYLRDDWWTTKY